MKINRVFLLLGVMILMATAVSAECLYNFPEGGKQDMTLKEGDCFVIGTQQVTVGAVTLGQPARQMTDLNGTVYTVPATGGQIRIVFNPVKTTGSFTLLNEGYRDVQTGFTSNLLSLSLLLGSISESKEITLAVEGLLKPTIAPTPTPTPTPTPDNVTSSESTAVESAPVVPPEQTATEPTPQELSQAVTEVTNEQPGSETVQTITGESNKQDSPAFIFAKLIVIEKAVKKARGTQFYLANKAKMEPLLSDIEKQLKVLKKIAGERVKQRAKEIAKAKAANTVQPGVFARLFRRS